MALNPLDFFRKLPGAVNTGIQNTVAAAQSPAVPVKAKVAIDYLKQQEEEKRKKAIEKAKQDALIASQEQAQKLKEAEAIRAQEAKSVPFQIMDKVGGAYNAVKPGVVEAGTQALNFANPVSNPILTQLLSRVGIKNTAGEAVQNFNKNFVTGAVEKTVEKPVQAWRDATLDQRVKAQTRQNGNVGDYLNDILGIGSNTGNIAMSAMPMVAGYNTVTGALQGNELTKGLGDAADAISSIPSKVIGAGVNQLPISDEAKQALSTLTNLGMVSLGSKAGKGIQKRINDVGYKAELMNSLNKNIAREGATFSSGPNFSPIIKALVDAEKKMVKNPVVQALDPTGVTTGAAGATMRSTNDGVDTGGIPPKQPPKGTNTGGIPSPEEVGKSLNDKLDALMQKTAGYTIKAPEAPMKKSILQKLLTPVTKVNDLYTGALRKAQDFAGTELERGLTSGNVFQRKAAETLQGFFRGVSMSPEREAAGMKFKGGLDVANARAYDVMDSLYNLVKKDKNSLERINAVLDPELAKTKIRFEDLTPTEQQAFGLIREGLDLVHDTSYANGNITPEVYAANKGKYTPRMYNLYELPDDIAQAVNRTTKKMEQDLYKSREGVDDWKMDESLNDPVYALGKRLAQVESNKTIKQYSDYILKNPKFVSDVEKPGYTKLGDSKAYGELSGKYVLNNIAEDFKGFFFTNETLNKMYDVIKAYDANPVRQIQKKSQTVYNLPTHLGNIASDNVFGFMVGVDPLTLNKNVAKLLTNKAERKQIADYLTDQGILGTSITRGEFTNSLKDIDALGKPQANSLLGKIKNIGKKVDNTITSAYGGTDDTYKMAAFKSLLDQGKSLEEATRLVSDGFQNYSKVGKLYDVAAKTPVFGSAYIKFSGDLMRMMKNAAVNRPLHLAGFVMSLKAIADQFSKQSGESEEDRKIREERLGAPYIPLPTGGKIPLSWQTPIGEINASRYLAPFFSNITPNEDSDSAFSRASKYIPFGGFLDAALSEKSDPAAAFSKAINDPLLGPIAQTFLDREFRGKSISDPNQSRYNDSTATDEEKRSNVFKFLQRSYTPPQINSVSDTISNLRGKPDYYGKERTPMQAVARLLGVKIEQFGKEQVDQQKAYEESGKEYDIQNAKTKVSDVIKEFLDPKIQMTEEIKNKRLRKISEDYPGFEASSYAQEILQKKLLENQPKPKTASQQKSEKRAEKKKESMQPVSQSKIDDLLTIINSNTKEGATQIIKKKYPTLKQEAIDKLFVLAEK